MTIAITTIRANQAHRTKFVRSRRDESHLPSLRDLLQPWCDVDPAMNRWDIIGQPTARRGARATSRPSMPPELFCERTKERKKVAGTVYLDFGLPCGRVVISRPGLWVAVVAQVSSPNGEPRFTLRRSGGRRLRQLPESLSDDPTAKTTGAGAELDDIVGM